MGVKFGVKSECLCSATKTKLAACLKDGVRAWWGVWRCKACQNSSGGLLKVQREKLGAITALLLFGHGCSYQLSQTDWAAPQRALMGRGQTSQSMCCCSGSMGNQRASSLGCCVLFCCRFSTTAAGFAPSLGWGTPEHGIPREGKACQAPPPPNSSLLGFTCPHRKLPLLLRLFPLLQDSFHDYLQRSSVLQKICADATELSDGSDSPADCNTVFFIPWVISQRFMKKGVPCSIGYCHYAAQSGTVMKYSYSNNRVPMKLWEDTEASEADWAGRSGLGFLSVRYPELCE